MRTASREATTLSAFQLCIPAGEVEGQAVPAGAAGDLCTGVALKCAPTMASGSPAIFDVAGSSSRDPVVSKLNTLYEHRIRRGIEFGA